MYHPAGFGKERIARMDVQQAILHEEIETRYLSYALSTIVSRALPDVRDGLKPVHRRILFAMHSIGASAASRFVKSARVVGEVIGKYHPHGDVAVYDAMVRMAQDFALRYPMVDGQGNFGSLDGDNAAAMRYTESRLSPIAEEFFNDLKRNTVAMRSNYDATLQEPAVLPVTFPNLLVNGSSGIAVGMTTSIPPHNMTEVCNALLTCIERQDIPTQDLMKIIKGPDFPTGGEILNDFEQLVQIYRDGHGSLRVRGTYQLEPCKRGRVQLVLTSIPYSVNKARLIERIAQLIQTRKLTLASNVLDESTEEVRIVLELKHSQVDPEKVMAYLYKHTPMEINFPLNFTCLTPEGVPERMSIKELLLHFLDFRKDMITRRLQFELQQIEERIHILEGFLILFDSLDEAITLIRQAESRAAAQKGLMHRYQLDAEQTDAILELRLQSLVRLEEDKLRREMAERSRRLIEIRKILDSEDLIWQEVRQELVTIKNRYGDRRRTAIAQKAPEFLYTTEDFIEHEDVWIVLTQMGRLKRLKHFDPGTFLLREDDHIFSVLSVNTQNRVAFFSNLGRVYILPVFELPPSGKGYGEPIQTIFSFQDGERVVACLALKKEPIQPSPAPVEEGSEPEAAQSADSKLPPGRTRQLGLLASESEDAETSGKSVEPTSARSLSAVDPRLVLITRKGKGMRLPLSYVTESTVRTGRQVMKLEKGDELAVVLTGEAPFILLATEKRVMILDYREIIELAGPGKGVKLMAVDPSGIRTAAGLEKQARLRINTRDGKQKDYSLKDLLSSRRGGKGRMIRGGIQDVEVPNS